MQIFNLSKNPLDLLPYQWDWSDFLHPTDDPLLATDTIIAAEVSAYPSGLTINTPDVMPALVRVLIGGGTTGVSYTLSCQITTQAGLIAVSERTLEVVEQAR